MRLVVKGATSQIEMFEILDSTSTTGGRKTGLVFNTASLTAYYTRAGAAAVAITLATQTVTGAYSSGGFVEVSSANAPGLYRLDVPDAAYATGVDSVVVTLKGATGMVQVSKEIMLTAVSLQDAVRAGLTALPNAAAEAAGGLYTRGSGAGQINQNASGQVDTRTVTMATDVITAAAIQADAIGAAEIANGAIDAATFAAGAIDAAAIATDAIGSAELAASAATEIATAVAAAILTTPAQLLVTDASGRVTVGSIASGAITATSIAADAITAAKVADGTIDAATFAAGAINAAAIATDAITAAKIAADAIGASELAADAVAEIADQVWDEVLSGHLTAGTTGNALNAAGSAGDPWATAIPGAYGAGTAGLLLGTTVPAAIAAVQSDTDNLQTRIPAALVSGRIDASVGAMAADTLTAAAAASDFGTEVGTAVWATTTRAITDKAGFSLSAAGVQAIWDALTSALTTVGSIGKLLVDNVNATISSRLASASYTAPDNADVVTILGLVDTEVAAIKAKTDLIPASPAAVSDIPTANANADALLDRTAGIETNRTVRQSMRLMLAVLGGKLSGAATATVTIRDTNDSKNRVVATVDSDGNRTAVTLDGT